MKINKALVDCEIVALERAVDTHHRELANGEKCTESKFSLIDRLIMTIADLQLVSPKLDIDRNSKEFKRIEVVGRLIQRMR